MKKILKNKKLLVSISIIILLLILSYILPLISDNNYYSTSIKERNFIPSFLHLFGTDYLGRDLWCRVWVGIRISIIIGVCGAILSNLIGILIGGMAGYKGGFIDETLMSVTDVVSCIPSLIYVTLIMIFLGNNTATLLLSISISSWMNCARQIRSRILQYINQDFIIYAKMQGTSTFRIIFKHIFPNISGHIITEFFFSIPSIIFIESYLSFLGLGISSPLTSLGQLCKNGISTFRLYPFQFFIPAIFLSVIVYCFYIIGNNLRNEFDRKWYNE